MVIVTTGTITKALREEGLPVDRDQVCYAVRRLCLEPIGVAGPARVFPTNAVEAVRDFLTKRSQPQPAATVEGAQ
jgi:hypothetical protein